MNKPAAIYCRISSDKTGKSVGVERQESDCRALAERLGVSVTYLLVDNDISAYSGKPRPQYQRLLDLMKQGDIGVVLAFHQDRLQRSPVELEQYVDISEAGRVTTHTVLAGHIDLSTPSGRFNARIIGAAARYEVEHMIERQQTAKLQAAMAGKYLGGQRPYGFEPKREGIRESEAAIVREIIQRVIDGDSFRTVAIDLNRRGVTTNHDKEWNALKVRNVAIRPINTGIVHHKGIDYEAETPAIIPRDQWDSFMAAVKLNRVRANHPLTFRKHILNGYLYCGKCGLRMTHKSKINRDGSKRTIAACESTDRNSGGNGGCGGVSRSINPILVLLKMAIVYRLDSPDVAAALQNHQSSAPNLKDLYAQKRLAEVRVNEITDDYYVNSLLTRPQYERAKAQADAKLKAIADQISVECSRGLGATVKIDGDIATAWDNANLDWRRNLLSILVEKIYIDPMPRDTKYKRPLFEGYRFDPELIRIQWRV
ncbi:recombinase family protein [Rhodococcus qingshengii]|uniref:recombinase family protein n=1 Tax=Rhodococcus qingshengii TaxID=334542 RepID=UPI00294386AF|nr:recombinase family protein [Rhodococcus qingshengii]WOI86012.1 recombinase family protein [Rhodococcus qingshengii]